MRRLFPLILISLIALTLGWYFGSESNNVGSTDKVNALIFKTPRTLGRVNLVDHHKKPFTEANLQGKWTLLYIGYTHCPDICPITMAEINNAYRQVTDRDYRDHLQTVLVSVDPARDTPDLLKAYVGNFHPEFIGVTGEKAYLDAFSQVSGMLYKIPENTDTNDYYTVDHSSHLLLINPDAAISASIIYPPTHANIIKTLDQVVANWSGQESIYGH